jgi:predicted TIM-barrel fold metal-dependent hydrolase
MTSNAATHIPPLCAEPDRTPRKPRHAIPPGTIDCHCHVFEDQNKYPLNANRSYTPPLCTRDDYLAMCATLGIARTVQVNASVYGPDNSVTLDLIAALGQDRARGVAGLALDTPSAHVERLNAGGFRGVRLSTSVKGYGGTDAIEPMSAKIRPFGWHIQLHVGKSAELAQHEARILKLAVPVVFDHLGCVRGSEGMNSPGFQALVRMLKARDDFWVKLSSWYRRSDMGAPYDDMKPIAQALMEARPDRCVWGTNWPHPECHVAMPNDGTLLDQFCDWVGDEVLIKKILVTNPEKLYFA